MKSIEQLRASIATTALLFLCLSVSISASASEVFSDGFESGDLSHAENGVKWGASSGAAVISSFARTGTHSLRFNYTAGADSWAEQRFNLGKDYKELYVQWYAYYPSGALSALGPKFLHSALSGANNNKFIRLWKGDTSDGNDGYTSFYVKVGASTDVGGLLSGDESIYGEYGTNGQGVGQNGSSGTTAWAGGISNFITDSYRGRWVEMKVHVKAASASGNDGVLEIWRDGVLVSSVKTLAIYPSGGVGNGFNFGYILGWANAGFLLTTNVYVDDVQFSTSDISPMPPSGITVQ